MYIHINSHTEILERGCTCLIMENIFWSSHLRKNTWNRHTWRQHNTYITHMNIITYLQQNHQISTWSHSQAQVIKTSSTSVTLWQPSWGHLPHLKGYHVFFQDRQHELPHRLSALCQFLANAHTCIHTPSDTNKLHIHTFRDIQPDTAGTELSFGPPPWEDYCHPVDVVAKMYTQEVSRQNRPKARQRERQSHWWMDKQGKLVRQTRWEFGHSSDKLTDRVHDMPVSVCWSSGGHDAASALAPSTGWTAGKLYWYRQGWPNVKCEGSWSDGWCEWITHEEGKKELLSHCFRRGKSWIIYHLFNQFSSSSYLICSFFFFLTDLEAFLSVKHNL